MNVKQIVAAHLREIGADGLCSTLNGCRCNEFDLLTVEGVRCKGLLFCIPAVLRDGVLVPMKQTKEERT